MESLQPWINGVAEDHDMFQSFAKRNNWPENKNQFAEANERSNLFPFFQLTALIFISFHNQNAVLIAAHTKLIEQCHKFQEGCFSPARSVINAAHFATVRFLPVRIDIVLRFTRIRKIPI